MHDCFLLKQSMKTWDGKRHENKGVQSSISTICQRNKEQSELFDTIKFFYEPKINFSTSNNMLCHAHETSIDHRDSNPFHFILAFYSFGVSFLSLISLPLSFLFVLFFFLLFSSF